MGWINSLFKFDHSQRDEEGRSLRCRELMCEDSCVRAPELFAPRRLRELEAAELCPSCDSASEVAGSVNVEHEDRAGAEVRDVQAALGTY